MYGQFTLALAQLIYPGRLTRDWSEVMMLEVMTDDNNLMTVLMILTASSNCTNESISPVHVPYVQPQQVAV